MQMRYFQLFNISLIICHVLYGNQQFIGIINEISPKIEKRIVGKSWEPECPAPLKDLRYLELSYWSYDDKVHRGEMIVHKDVANDVIATFEELFENKFPIEKMHLIEKYMNEGMTKRDVDMASVADNNTSAFFYRCIGGTNIISEHGLGTAIDINPRVNPYYNICSDYVCPPDAREFLDRSRTDIPGLVTKESICYQAFSKRGWKWGGNWPDVKDYQHFCLKEILHKSPSS